jgi:4'-phosphopantetheinyl transferase
MATALVTRILPCPSALTAWSPGNLKMESSEINVWRAGSAIDRSQIDHLQTLLSDDERQRRDRFRFQRDADQYTVAHGMLRILLGAYTGMKSRDLTFQYSPKGKPDLTPALNSLRLHFNVAHSGEVILLAFARERRIGVDVERIRPDVECDELAQHYFSPAERVCLGHLPESRRRDAFFACWTRKEAYLKGMGGGLTEPLNSFDVYVNSHCSFHRLHVAGRAKETWWVENLDTDTGYAAAVAVEEGERTGTLNRTGLGIS